MLIFLRIKSNSFGFSNNYFEFRGIFWNYWTINLIIRELFCIIVELFGIMKNGFPRRFKVFLNTVDLIKVVFLNATLFRGKMVITIVKFFD